MRNNLLILTAVVFISACSSDSIKEKINKTGNVAGQAIGEFSTGVTSGVEKATEPKIEFSRALKQSGVSFGKSIVASDTNASDNILTVYLIFNSAFNGDITAKAFDNKDVEMGRVKLRINAAKDDAGYYEFHFDKRTNIDNDSRLVVE